jgi:hypothetical protein
MVYLAIALGIALIVLVASNAVWLYFFLQISRDSARERWSLLERIRDPQAAMPNPEPKPMSKEDQSVLENWIANTEVEDEFDLTGRIDPATPLRSEDK